MGKFMLWGHTKHFQSTCTWVRRVMWNNLRHSDTIFVTLIQSSSLWYNLRHSDTIFVTLIGSNPHRAIVWFMFYKNRGFSTHTGQTLIKGKILWMIFFVGNISSSSGSESDDSDIDDTKIHSAMLMQVSKMLAVSLFCQYLCWGGGGGGKSWNHILPFSQGSRPSYDTTWEEAVRGCTILKGIQLFSINIM